MGSHAISVAVKRSRQKITKYVLLAHFFSFYKIIHTFLIYGIMHSQFVIDVLSHRLMIEN